MSERPGSDTPRGDERCFDLKPDAKGFAYVLMWMDHLLEHDQDADPSYVLEWRVFVEACRSAMLSETAAPEVDYVKLGAGIVLDPVPDDKADDAFEIAKQAIKAMAEDGWLMHGVEGMSEAQELCYQAYRQLGLKDLPDGLTPQSAVAALTDEEIVAAWNSAGETRPRADSPDLYLHYMRAVAKAQRDKIGMPSATGARDVKRCRHGHPNPSLCDICAMEGAG